MSEETANFHARYLYRGYLQVAECGLDGGNASARAQLHLGSPRNLKPRAS